MKTLAFILFISAFLVLSNADSCSDAYEFADMSINSLRNNFFDDQYANMYEDLENVMKSAELIKDSCPGPVNFHIDGSQFYSCSLAYSMLSQILDDYGFQRDAETVSTLSQIVSLIPSIEEKYCLDDWEITALKNQDSFDDEIWTDYDRTDDYDYDRSDDYDPNSLIEDEEEEDTGDEMYRDSDDDGEEDIEQDKSWPADEIQEYGSDIQSDYTDEESEDEDDEIESDDENDDTDSTIAPEMSEQEDTIMVFVNLSNEPNLVNEIEVDIEEDILAEDIPASKEDEDMIMVFVDMTNMSKFGNIEGNLDEEEESLSIYADISVVNGELIFEEEDNNTGSIFVYVDIDTALGVNEVVNAVFADNQDDDVEVEVGELDLQQYWDDEEDEEDY